MHRNAPTRRQFLAAAALAAAPAAPEHAIDTHTHFYDPSRPGGVPWPPATDKLLHRTVLPRDFKQVTAGLGIEGTVVVEASPLVEDNQWLLDLARENPVIVGVIGRLDPASRDFPELLSRFTRNPLFRGIRLNSAAIAAGMESKAFLAGMQGLAAKELTLDAIGPTSMFPVLERLAERVRGLKIVIDHLPFDRQAGFPIGRNIYAKISGVRPDTPRRAIDEVYQAFGPDRVLYGSNWPVCERAAPYAATLRTLSTFFASKGPEAAAKFFRDNSRTAYGWVARPQ